MNKLFTKIVGAFLGLTLAVGVGVVAANNSKSVDPAYAADATMTSFSSTSGNVGDDENVTYAAYRGGGTSNAVVNTNAIRLYQNSGNYTGGMLVVQTSSDYEISSITIRSTMDTTVGIIEGTEYTGTNSVAKTDVDSSQAVPADTDVTFNNLSSNIVTMFCLGTTSSTRWYVSKLSVTYSSASSCEHDWGSGVVTTPATCTTPGVRTYTCSKCSDTKTEEIPAGHTWVAGTVHAATCTEAGYTEYECSVCHEEKHDNEVDALGHNYVNHVCSRCGAEEPLAYVITFGNSNSGTYPTSDSSAATIRTTYSVDNDITIADISKIYALSGKAIKCGSGKAAATISFTIPSDSYIVSVVVAVQSGNSANLGVTSGKSGAETESQAIVAGTLTFDDNLATDQSNKVTLASSASGAFYLASITINYANFAPELSASPSSFDVAVNGSQNVTLTSTHFTPTSYSAVVKSGSSLTTSSVEFNNNVATITAGSTTGVTVFTITGTGGGKNASVDVTVNVTQVRNLTNLTITTISNATTFKVGDTFDIGSLVITATFDADPTTVVYSKANGNMGVLTATPAIGYEFQESDIGTITTAVFELEVGTGDETVEYTINVIDKTYAAKVTDVQDLWDGQQVYFGDQDGTRVNIAHAGTTTLGTQEATVHETKGLCIDDLSNNGAYTVHREKISGTTYYSFEHDGYYLDASITAENQISRSTTLSDTCRYTISISNGKVNMTNKGNNTKPLFRWNAGNYFSQYPSNTTMKEPVIYALTTYDETSVASAFESRWLRMDTYDPDQETEGQPVVSPYGECETYYWEARDVWQAMGEYEKAAISAKGEARLIAWAAANGQTLDGNMDLVSNSRIISLDNVNTSNATLIIVAISMISATALAGYVFLRKRRED